MVFTEFLRLLWVFGVSVHPRWCQGPYWGVRAIAVCKYSQYMANIRVFSQYLDILWVLKDLYSVCTVKSLKSNFFETGVTRKKLFFFGANIPIGGSKTRF